MDEQYYLADRKAVDDAVQLIDEHGAAAAIEASARADRSRNLGNIVHFCRWRQVERFVTMLAKDEVEGTVH